MQGQTALTDLFNTRFEELRATFAPDIAASDFFDSFGMTSGSDYSDNYWTCDEISSEQDSSGQDIPDQALRMNFGCDATKTWSSIKINGVDKYKTWAYQNAFIMKVRPFLAF